MQTSNTALFFLEDDCIRAFGQETGCTLLQQAEELYQDLCQHGNDRGNHVIEEHLQSRLFPLMSYAPRRCSATTCGKELEEP